MEGQKNKSLILTEVQQDIFEEIYFVTGYEELSRNIDYSRAEIINALREMMQNHWVEQYHRSVKTGEVIPNPNPDLDRLERFYYVATKKGLLHYKG